MSDYDLIALSLGLGYQSTALALLAVEGKIRKPSVAIFADTGAEPAYVYEHQEKLRPVLARAGIELRVCENGNLERHLLGQTTKRAGSDWIPAFVQAPDRRLGTAAILKRQCTRHYKLDPIAREIRKCLGLGPRSSTRNVRVLQYVGISTDEAQRMKPAAQKYITTSWPLIDLGLSRDDCKRVCVRHGFGEIKKSACVFCPYHDNAYWRFLKFDHPADFERACLVDDSIRDVRLDPASGISQQCFLHRSLMPLRLVDFERKGQPELFDGFGNECEGICGV